MPDELRQLALDLKSFLAKYHRVSNIEGPEPLNSDWRSWELSFVHRGLRRHFVYRIERVDPIGTMYQALRADSSGELLVRIPTADLSNLLTNDIYYPPHG